MTTPPTQETASSTATKQPAMNLKQPVVSRTISIHLRKQDLGLIGGGLLAISLYLTYYQMGYPWDFLSWVTSLGMLTWFFWPDAGNGERIRWPNQQTWLIVLLLLVLACFTRIYRLESLPRIIHGDEADFGLIAREISEDGLTSLFGVTQFHLFPRFTFFLQSLTMMIAQNSDLFGLRLSSMLFGALTVIPIFGLTQILFNRPAAVAAVFLFGVSHWAMHFSRVGINNIQATFFAAWAIYLWALATRSESQMRWFWYCLTGVALGLGLYTYQSARLMVPIVALMIVLHHKKQAILPLLITGLGIIWAFAPQALFYWQEPHTIAGRERATFILYNLGHLEFSYGIDNLWQILALQIWHSIRVFFDHRDTSGHYGFQTGILDNITALLLIGGCLISLRDWRRQPVWIIHLWFWFQLIVVGGLTIDSPSVPRFASLMPVPFIFAGVAVAWGWSKLVPMLGRRETMTLAALVMVATLWLNQADYLTYDAERTDLLAATEAGLFLQTVADAESEVYMLGAPMVYGGFSVFQFVAREVTVIDIHDLAAWRADRESGQVVLVIVWFNRQNELPWLREAFPNHIERDYRTWNDLPLFWATPL